METEAKCAFKLNPVTTRSDLLPIWMKRSWILTKKKRSACPQLKIMQIITMPSKAKILLRLVIKRRNWFWTGSSTQSWGYPHPASRWIYHITWSWNSCHLPTTKSKQWPKIIQLVDSLPWKSIVRERLITLDLMGGCPIVNWCFRLSQSYLTHNRLSRIIEAEWVQALVVKQRATARKNKFKRVSRVRTRYYVFQSRAQSTRQLISTILQYRNCLH